MRNLAKRIAALTALTFMSACGTTRSSESTAPTSASDGDVVATQEAENFHKIGEMHRYSDGLDVTVQKIESLPEESLDSDVNGSPVLITIIVRNGTGKTVDTASFGEWITSGGVEATTYTDPDIGAQDPTSDLLPGGTITYKVAAIVNDPQAIQIDWGNSTLDHPHSHWISTGSVERQTAH